MRINKTKKKTKKEPSFVVVDTYFQVLTIKGEFKDLCETPFGRIMKFQTRAEATRFIVNYMSETWWDTLHTLDYKEAMQKAASQKEKLGYPLWAMIAAGVGLMLILI